MGKTGLGFIAGGSKLVFHQQRFFLEIDCFLLVQLKLAMVVLDRRSLQGQFGTINHFLMGT